MTLKIEDARAGMPIKYTETNGKIINGTLSHVFMSGWIVKKHGHTDRWINAKEWDARKIEVLPIISEQQSQIQNRITDTGKQIASLMDRNAKLYEALRDMVAVCEYWMMPNAPALVKAKEALK